VLEKFDVTVSQQRIDAMLPFDQRFANYASSRLQSAITGMASVRGVRGNGNRAAFLALSIHDQIAPPTINLDEASPECDLDYVPNTARKMQIRAGLSNSFGFGGTNACVIMKKFEE